MLVDPSDDVHNPEVQEKWKKECGEADFAWFATCCKSQSRARERPIPGHPKAPGPLRSDEYVRGLPHLSGDDLRKVTEGNLMADITWECVHKILDANDAGQFKAAGVENPRNSYLWQ